MTNLDRLKGTPYFMDGFESCLREWLKPEEPSLKGPDWTDDEWDLVRTLPECVQQFYEVIHRWPSAGIAEGRGSHLKNPPQFSRHWHAIGQRWDINPDRVDLVAEPEFRWYAELSITESDFGQLYYHDLQKEKKWRKMKTPVEDLLVTFALFRLFNDDTIHTAKDSLFSEAACFYEGCMYEGEPWRFHHHSEGLIWLQYPSGTRTCAAPPHMRD